MAIKDKTNNRHWKDYEIQEPDGSWTTVLQLLRDNDARLIVEIEKNIKEGNPLSKGKGICKCIYRKDGSRLGLCLRCADDQLHAHREGELKALKKILAIIKK